MSTLRNPAFEEWLLLRAQLGDRSALERLLALWQPRLYAHACRLLGDADRARDVHQEALMAIVRGLARLADPAAFRAWCYRIVSNKCADHIRREQRRRAVDRELAAEAVEGRDGPGPEILDLRQAIKTLPGEQRALLAMFYLEGLGIAEIARSLNIPPGTVKSRLFHLRRRLARQMEGERHEICG